MPDKAPRSAQQQMKRNRVVLLSMFAMTILPFGLASLFFEHLKGDTTWPTSNQGRFLKPPVQIQSLHLQTLAGLPLAEHKWRLLLYRPRQCMEICATAEHNLRALPILLGRDASRVQIALLSVDGAALDADPAASSSPITQLKQTGHVPGVKDQGLVVVDPLGNIVLAYSYEQVAKPLLDDMRHLMKVSQFG